MGARISRRKIAAYIADELIAGHDVVKQLAAFLVESRRVREASLIVRDIEAALEVRGVLFADISSGRTLSDEVERSVAEFLANTTGAHDVRLRKRVDEYLLGGVLIETPGKRLDASLRHRLDQLIATKS